MLNKSLFRALLRGLAALLVLVTAIGAAASQPAQAAPLPDGWIPFTAGAQPGAAPAVRILQASDTAITLLAETPGMQSSSRELAGTQYTVLACPGCSHSSQVGAPDLPVLRRAVEIPQGATASIELINAPAAQVSLQSLGLPAVILPVQPSQPKCGGLVEPCLPDESIYGLDAAHPATPVRIAGEYEVRGHRVVVVEISPLAYQPASGMLTHHASIQFNIRLEGGDPAASAAEAERLASPAFDSLLASQILNYHQGAGGKEPENYLIITADVYETGLADFVSLKQAQGFNVTLASLTDVGGTTTTAIKNYITAQYNGDYPPDYVLLVGDHNDGTDSLPAWLFPGYSYYTDLFYGTMGGSSDYVPDIHIGRFPVRETSQLANMVNNAIYYEEDVTGAEDWVKKAAFLASDDGSWYWMAEATHNYVINTYTLGLGYTGIFPVNPQPGGDKLYAITYNADSTDVVNSINDDRAMVIYSGHGSPTSWAGPSLNQSQVRNLTGVISPYVAGHACVTSDFTTNESFGDTWVIQNGKGALTYLGASNNSYWDEDDVLERVIFDTLYDAVPVTPSVAEMKWEGLMAVQMEYPSSANYYWEEYHLFGDPSTVIVLGPRSPDFTLAVAPNSFAVCNDAEINAAVTVGSINDFAEEVSLSAADAPAGFTPALDPETVTPPGSSTLTLAGDGTAAFGTYTVTVSGQAGLLSHSADVVLDVYSTIPAAPLLALPADDAANVDPLTVFDWEDVDQAVSYRIQVALDPAFSSVVLDVPGLAASTYAAPTAFQTDTHYYWRVIAENPCGSENYSAVFHFRTRPGPGDCPDGTTPQTLYQTDFEDGSTGWVDTSTGTYHWAESTVRAHSPETAWLGQAVAAIADQRLVSPAIILPAGEAPLSLSFWHWRALEAGASSCTDGAILEVSTNGGSSWVQVPTARLLTDPYDGNVRTGVFNPLAGKAAWCGSVDWTWSVVDLDVYAGQTVQFRFRLGTGNTGSAEGWYLDDVRVQSCVAEAPGSIFLPVIVR